MSVLSLRGVRWAYQAGQPVLDGLDFRLEEGEVVGLLGRNGAGKTTLLHLALGLLEPMAGSVAVFDENPRQDPLRTRARVGFVAENQVLPPHLRLGDLIRWHQGLFPEWDRTLERSLRERFGMSRRARIRDLSKGQARQAALLCAVCHAPELLLLDEPAAGLDPSARRGFLETAIQILSERGTTILFSSHHMADVERLASRVVLLHGGRFLLDGDQDEIREGYTLVRLPAGEPGGAALRAMAGCVAWRENEGAASAILAMDAAEAAARLRAVPQLERFTCVNPGLEDLFVELVGGAR